MTQSEEDRFILDQFHRWQMHAMRGGPAIYVERFSLSGQSEGFLIKYILYNTISDETMDEKYVFGTPIECVNQVLKGIEDLKNEMRKKLDAE